MIFLQKKGEKLGKICDFTLVPLYTHGRQLKYSKLVLDYGFETKKMIIFALTNQERRHYD